MWQWSDQELLGEGWLHANGPTIPARNGNGQGVGQTDVEVRLLSCALHVLQVSGVFVGEKTKLETELSQEEHWCAEEPNEGRDVIAPKTSTRT